MINHATLEVPRDKMDDEVAWWKMVMGFAEEEPYSDKYGARWVYRWQEYTTTDAGGAVEAPLGAPVGVRIRCQLHLFPVPHAASVFKVETARIPRFGHLAFAFGAAGLGQIIAAQQHFGGRCEQGTSYWGAPRYMVDSPSGHRVEVMERGPLPEGHR